MCLWILVFSLKSGKLQEWSLFIKRETGMVFKITNQYQYYLFFQKYMKRLISNRLIIFLSNSRIFTEAQNGFRNGNCIETAIQSFIERIQEVLDKGLHMIAMFFYLTKAYDVLKHRISLEKLYCYGIRGSTNSWFQAGIGPLIRK